MKRVLALLALASAVLFVRAGRRPRPRRAHEVGAHGVGAHGVGADQAGADQVDAHGLGADLLTPGFVPDAVGAAAMATDSGLSKIDPQPLTHIAGEGVVPGELEAAYDAPRELRDRLPRTGEEP